MTTEEIAEVLRILNEAQAILTANPPDMDVTEWNATPIGRAVSRIAVAIEMLEEAL